MHRGIALAPIPRCRLYGADSSFPAIVMMSIEDLSTRAVIIDSIRLFFKTSGYLEVDTPIRLPTPIPEASIEPVPSAGWFLQSSPEIFMKRLLAQGCDRLFQICHCFRAGESGSRHLPEFTMLEWYRTGTDYHGLMTECENLLRQVAATASNEIIQTTSGTITLTAPWHRMTVAEAFRCYAPMNAFDAVATDSFDQILVEHVEPHLGCDRPLFLYDYPAPLASLARKRADQPEVAERFELYINGVELANGFSELTDVAEQRQRFCEENAKIAGQGRHPAPLPEKFLHDLQKMPEAAGIALGVDRLVMLLLGKRSIDQAVPFGHEDL